MNVYLQHFAIIHPSSLLTSTGELTLLVADVSNGSARHTTDENFIARCTEVDSILFIEFGKNTAASYNVHNEFMRSKCGGKRRNARERAIFHSIFCRLFLLNFKNSVTGSHLAKFNFRCDGYLDSKKVYNVDWASDTHVVFTGRCDGNVFYTYVKCSTRVD
jgi:hypothetical protein